MLLHDSDRCLAVGREGGGDLGEPLGHHVLRHLARVTAQTEWRCVGFCLMRTHYHLILEVEDGVLPVAMHSLNLAYARQFNRRHGLRGHAQSRRYGSRRIAGNHDPDPADYVSWDYARGFADGVLEASEAAPES